MRVCYRLVCVLLAATFAPSICGAQDIGLPPRIRFSVGPYFVSGGSAVGVLAYRDILNAAVGALGVQAEGYAGVSGNDPYQSFALGLRSPVLRLAAGVNIDWPGTNTSPFVSFTHPIRRGGFLVRGGLVHATWLFSSPHKLRAGLSIPVGQKWVGQSRPKSDRVNLSGSQDHTPGNPSAWHDWVMRVNEAVVPDVRAPTAQSWNANDAINGYHAHFDSMFGGRNAGDSVRVILRDSLLLPFDRLLGQKREPESLAPFTDATLKAVTPRAAPIVRDLIAAMDEVVRLQRARMGDIRLVWLPLQLALRNEQHETQSQVDSLIERGANTVFSDSNEVVYVRNDKFQGALTRSLHDAQKYHVLWIHDFQGVNKQGTADSMAYHQLTDGYLDALITRVRAYDATGILPEYHLFVDAYFYELCSTRPWMMLLRNPLGARVRLPHAPVEWQMRVDSMQNELRAAVAHSTRLQRDLVRVHVHVTHQSDPSFLSNDILPIIGMSDNAMHDHRKLFFYDLTETDPYRGLLTVAGVGVGEVYAGPAWEDRAAIMRGNAALLVKREMARLLTGSGVNADKLPTWLQASHDTVPAAARAPTPHFDENAIQTLLLHNEVGYGDKPLTVSKAMLYSMQPAGAVIKSANALWLNPLWGSLLLGHALRGGRVLIMAPSFKNSAMRGQEMGLAAELLQQLLNARHTMAAALEKSGGMLRIGMYNLDVGVDDVPARIDTALAIRARTPWLRELEPFSQEVIDSLRAVAQELRRTPGGNGAPRAPGDPPKLHIKQDFVASTEAWENLFEQPGWGAALADYFRKSSAAFELRAQVQPKKSERVIYYLMAGSFNNDYRSALLDGESVLVIARFGAAIGIGDAVLLPSLCTWVDSAEEIPRYLPGKAGWLAHAMKILF